MRIPLLTFTAILAVGLAACGDAGSSAEISGPLAPEETEIVEKLSTIPTLPTLAEERNAAHIYRKLFDKVKTEYFSEKARNVWWAKHVEGTPIKEAGFPEPIPESAEGSRESDGYELLYRVEGLDCNFEVNWSGGFEIPLPHLQGMRNLARVMMIQAFFDHENDKPQRALKHIRPVYTLAEHVSREPALISHLVALAIRNIADATITLIALERPDDKEFLKEALELIDTAPKLRSTVADAFRSDCHIIALDFLAFAGDTSSTSAGFAFKFGRILDLTGHKVPDGLKDPEPAWASGRASGKLRRWFEEEAGLPRGSFNDKTFRSIVGRMAIFWWKQADAQAAAWEEGPAQAHVMTGQLETARQDQWPEKPESLFARFFSPSFGYSLSTQAKSDMRRMALEAMLRAFLEGKDNVSGFVDVFGRPCTMTRFDDGIYFECDSYWSEPHDLDFTLGEPISYEEYLERTAAAKPTEGDGS